MINSQAKQPLNRVTAIFPDGPQSFLLPQGATLEQIADRVDGLCAQRAQQAIDVVVKFAAASVQSSAPPTATAFRTGLLAELPRLRAFATSLARNADRADDLVQEALTKAWAHQSKFKEGTNLRAWLFTILRNTYFGELRSRRREVSDSAGRHAARLSSPPAQGPYLELQSVARAFEGLTPVQREALFLVGASGLSYYEAARIGGCALGTVKSRVSRARKLLLQKLAGWELETSSGAMGTRLAIARPLQRTSNASACAA